MKVYREEASASTSYTLHIKQASESYTRCKGYWSEVAWVPLLFSVEALGMSLMAFHAAGNEPKDEHSLIPDPL